MNPLNALPLVFAGLTLSASAAEEPPKYVTDARASVERRRLVPPRPTNTTIEKWATSEKAPHGHYELHKGYDYSILLEQLSPPRIQEAPGAGK